MATYAVFRETSDDFLMDNRSDVTFNMQLTYNQQVHVLNQQVGINVYVVNNSTSTITTTGTVYIRVGDVVKSISLTDKSINSGESVYVAGGYFDISFGAYDYATVTCDVKFDTDSLVSDYSTLKSYTMICEKAKEEVTTFDVTFTEATSASDDAWATLKVDLRNKWGVDAYSHKIDYTIGQTTYTAGTEITTESSTFSIPWSAMAELKNATSRMCTVTVTTIYGVGIAVGKTSKTFVATIPECIKPSISDLTLSVIAAGAATSYGYVQGKSMLRATVEGAEAGLYSTIKSYRIEQRDIGFLCNTSSGTSKIIMQAGTFEVVATVTDERGRTASVSKSFTVSPYTPPVINSFTAYRTNMSGAKTEDGTYFKCLAKFTDATGVSSNYTTGTVTYRRSDLSSTTSIGNVTSGTESKNKGSGSINASYSYVLTLTVKDSIGSTATREFVLSSKQLPIDIMDTGDGVGIGKTAQGSGRLDIGYTTYHDAPTYHSDDSYYGDSVTINKTGVHLQNTDSVKPSITLIPESVNNANAVATIEMPRSGVVEITAKGGLKFPTTDLYLSDGETRERAIYFYNSTASSGTTNRAAHKCKIYGGNANNGTAIGVYDTSNSMYVWSYNDGHTASGGTTTKQFVVNPNITFSAKGTVSTSDERLKHNIKEMDSRYLDLLYNLKCYTFKYNDGDSGRDWTGFIAQQMEEALEESGIDTNEFAGFVKYEKSPSDVDWNGYEDEMGIRYDQMISIYALALQEQKKQLDRQQEEMNTMRAEIDELKKLIEQKIG